MKRSHVATSATFFAAAIALLAFMLQPSSAQVVVGHGGGPEVQVNLGVLDNLPASGPVSGSKSATHLKRPGSAAKASTPKAAAKRKTAAKSKPAAKRTAAAAELHKPAAAEEHAKPTKTAAIAESTTPAPAKIETAELPAGPASAREASETPPLPPLPQPAAAPEPASEASAAPKPTAAEKSPPAKDESAALPAVVATAQPAPAPAPAAPAVVAGGLLGGGDISEPVGAVNVPPRAAPSVPRERQQTAAVAPPAGSGGGFRVGFSGSSADLSPAAQSQLAELAQLLVGGSDRIMLNGYASGESASGARRVALSRVLAVRAFLVDKGVQQPRIDVRAVGTPNDGGSPERVDIAKIGR